MTRRAKKVVLPKAERRRLARANLEAKSRPPLKQASAVIFTSANGRAPWHPLKPEEVPEWVKHPDVMARLLAGEECYDPTIGDKGSNFYRAVRTDEINEAMKGDH